MKPILEIRNIWKKYKVGEKNQPYYLTLREQLKNVFKPLPKKEIFWALKDITLDIFPGECVGIIGRNGAGKSTLLKILSKITPPTKGHIKSRGRIASLLEVGTGFHQELTGRENIYLDGSVMGLRRSEINKKFDAIVDFSGVEDFLDMPLKHYSTGMELRLAFAVAAHLEPEILLIDEVLAVGDAEFQQKCLGKMEEVSQSGRTVIFVSHNMGLVKLLCRRTILLSSSEKVMDSETSEVTDYYLNLVEKEQPEYRAKDIEHSKSVYFEYIKLINYSGQSAEINHDKPIILEFKFIIRNFVKGLLLTISLTDKFKNRIFTVQNTPDTWGKSGNKEKTLRFILPPNLLVPSLYSWILAFHIPGIDIIDEVKDVCPFRIRDAGSEAAFFKGEDYGHIFLKDYKIEVL